MATNVSQIIAAFGGHQKLAVRLGVPITTAHTWKRKKKIPAWRLDAIARAASEDGIEIKGLASRKKAA